MRRSSSERVCTVDLRMCNQMIVSKLEVCQIRLEWEVQFEFQDLEGQLRNFWNDLFDSRLLLDRILILGGLVS